MTHVLPSTYKLTDIQLVLLSRASQRADGKVVPPAHLKGGILRQVMASLIGRGLVEPAAAAEDTIAGGPVNDPADACPVISPAGLAALGIADDADIDTSGGKSAVPDDTADGPGAPGETAGSLDRPSLRPDRSRPGTRQRVKHTTPGVTAAATPDRARAKPEAACLPRAGSKQARVLGLLAQQDGASLDEIRGATGWLPHTARAVLSRLRKRGYTIERLGK